MSSMTTKDWQTLDKANHLHPFTDLASYSKTGGAVISRAEGVYIFDHDGKQILDGMSGLWCTNLGYTCLLYTSPSPRDLSTSRMPSSA